MKSFDKTKEDLNLLKQVENIKNYHKLQERLKKTTKQIMRHKKTMSFNNKKIQFDNYLKVRKEKTILFRKRQEQMMFKSNDTKMLSKILDYNRKLYSFSVHQQPKYIEDSNLHHNSKVSFNKNVKTIDQQNQKIHYRIRKAQSIYSQQKIKNKTSTLSNTFFLTRKSQLATMQNKAESSHKFITEYEPLQEETIKIQYNNVNAKTERDEPLESINKEEDQRTKSQKKTSDYYSITKIECKRTRCQKLAAKMFQNKLKYQKKISNRLFVKH